MIKNDGNNKIQLKGIHKGKLLFAGIFLSVLILASAVFVKGCSNKEAAGAGGGAFSMPPMPVEVAEAKLQKISDKFEAVGSVEATEAITVVSEIDALVKALPFQEGTFIKRGTIIAQLDDSQLSAEVTRTEALYTQSQVTYDRVKNIVGQKAGSVQDLDNAAATLKVAQANLDLARARLAKTKITAPFDGVIGARKISVGTFLRAGQPIAELANINEIRVNFSSPENYLSQLKRGAEVSVSTTAYPGYEAKGRITVIEPVLNPDTRSVRVVARMMNPGQKFLPGMSADVSAVLTERPNAIVIPSEAVFANGNQSFVFRVNPDATVSQIPVKTGLQMADVVEITGGLEQGMKIVQAGHQKLFEGAKIFPVNSKTAAK